MGLASTQDVDTKKAAAPRHGCTFGSKAPCYYSPASMNRPLFFKDPVFAENAERLRFFRPEPHFTAAFGADGDEIEHAG